LLPQCFAAIALETCWSSSPLWPQEKEQRRLVYPPAQKAPLFWLANERKRLYSFVSKFPTKRWFCNGDTNETQ